MELKLDISNPNAITYCTEELGFTILGGIRMDGLDRLRVTIRIEVINRKFEHYQNNPDLAALPLNHNLDLYNDVQVEKLIRKAAERLEVGTFFKHDRYADSYLSFNPYQYTANNPINFSDYNGDYITIDRKDDKGNVMLSLLYEGGKAYFYSKDKDGNAVKGDAWNGTDNFITQAVSDLGEISSTKEGKTMVNDLQGSKFGYSISETNNILNSSFEGKDGTKGGGSILYNQKGGSHVNAKTNRSSVVLGHELYHGWAFEFSHEPKTMNFGERLLRETNAVKFENYLRASFGESVMRTHYRLKGNNQKVASSSVEEALNYQLPTANYYKFEIPERRVHPQADNTINGRPIKIEPIDTRKTKF